MHHPPTLCTLWHLNPRTQDVDPKALTATAQVAMTTSGALRHAGNELMMPEGYLLNIAFNK